MTVTLLHFMCACLRVCRLAMLGCSAACRLLRATAWRAATFGVGIIFLPVAVISDWACDVAIRRRPESRLTMWANSNRVLVAASTLYVISAVLLWNCYRPHHVGLCVCVCVHELCDPVGCPVSSPAVRELSSFDLVGLILANLRLMLAIAAEISRRGLLAAIGLPC